MRRHSNVPGLPELSVQAIHETASGTLYVATSGGVSVLGAGEFVQIEGLAEILPSPTPELYDDPDGGVWVKSEKGSALLARGTVTVFSGRWPFYRRDEVASGPDGRRLLRSPDGVIHRDDEAVLDGYYTSAVAKDDRGNLFIAAEEGLLRVRVAWLRTLSTADGLPDDNIYPILEGRAGEVWIGTWVSGLARYRDGAVAPAGPWRLASTLSLYEDAAGALWVSTMGSVCVMRDETCTPLPPAAAELVKGGARVIAEDSAGRIWLGTQTAVVVGTPSASASVSATHPSSGDSAFAMADDDAGSAMTWRAFGTAEGLSSAWARALLETRSGEILLATNGGGVARWAHDEFEVFGIADGLPSEHIRDLHEDDSGRLWIATEDAALCRATLPLRRPLDLDCLNSSRGLFDDSIHRILDDGMGRLWMSTNQGIFWADREDLDAVLDGARDRLTPVGYSEAHGMLDREANGGMQPAGMRDRRGRLWFPTQGGMVIFDPATIARSQPPVVVIERVSVGGAVRSVATGLAADVRLRPVERDLEFRWTALEFSRPEEVRYRYRLRGYDASWHDAGSQTRAMYSGLPAGRL